MRIRNRGHSARISSALKAPCLTERSLDEWASLFAVDIAGEGQECAVSMKTRWSEINLGRYHDQEPLLPFLDESRVLSRVSLWPKCLQTPTSLWSRPSTGLNNQREASARRRQKFNANVEDLPFPQVRKLRPKPLSESMTPSRYNPSLLLPPIASTNPSRQPHCLSVRLFPFMLPDVCLPISSTPMATSIPSTVQTKLSANVRPPRLVTSSTCPWRLLECHAVWIRKSRRRETGNVFRKVLVSKLGSVHRLSLRGLLGVLRWRLQHHCSSSALALSNSVGSFFLRTCLCLANVFSFSFHSISPSPPFWGL